jgi:xanthine dehydrogenase iron-sulfur cluster and FAD-binding subunit A
VKRADLENTIAEALDGHICRCTGYIKYHEAGAGCDPGGFQTLSRSEPVTGRENAA